MVAAFAAEGVDPFVYDLGDGERLNVYHRSEMNRQERHFYEERRHLEGKRFVLGDSRELTVPSASTILVFGMGEAVRVEAVAERLREWTVYRCRATAIFSTMTWPISRFSVRVSARLRP